MQFPVRLLTLEKLLYIYKCCYHVLLVAPSLQTGVAVSTVVYVLPENMKLLLEALICF